MHKLMTALAAALLLTTPAMAQRDWGGRGDQGGARWSNDSGNRAARANNNRPSRDTARPARPQARANWQNNASRTQPRAQRAEPRRDAVANRDRMERRDERNRNWAGNDRRRADANPRWSGNDDRRRLDNDRRASNRTDPRWRDNDRRWANNDARYRYDRERYRYDRDRYRYDRQRYQDRNRYVHAGRYGYGRPNFYSWPYRSWGRGQYIPRDWWGSGGWNPYLIGNYGYYGLHRPPSGFGWIRYHDDLLLVALTSGLIREVMRGYWRDRDYYYDDYY